MKSSKRGSDLGIASETPFRFDLDADTCSARRAKLFGRLDPRPDLIVMGGVDHLVYFANFFVPQYIFQANNASAYLVMTPDECTLVHDNLLDGFAERAAVDHRQCVTWYRGQEPAGDRLALVAEETRKLVEKSKPDSIGVSLARTPGNIYLNQVEKLGRPVVTDVDPVIRRMRVQKDADELQLLRTCGAAVSRVMDFAWKNVKPSMTELELFNLMQLEA
ncbi:MAG: aminopeptidase P family N-terminal domain-containing protein, partial [Isosphaeraceae bacterium]